MRMLFALTLLPSVALAAPASRFAAVENGVLRWQDDHSEVALFGVNYYPPFSIDYALIKSRGLDHEQAIRDDVAHFERLGLTAIRLHCWDREISDHDGNLRDNEHLRLLDLLINECSKRGIYAVMTPIAWWGGGESGGFSDLYTMHQMTTDHASWPAQCNYLKQYLNHVNRYTGKAFKDDPAIVALELINEPLYPAGTTDAQVTEYVNTLCQAVRDTGCRKPVFYNCWGPRFKAAADSTLDGVTFGWYPTGLVSGGMLKGNYLPAVQDYPDMREPLLAKKAKIVYEFDAADVPKTYMYPAMARAFRRGGAQSATQFQYDPMCIADGNPNWQTHFLNLCYTPGKAISFAIAAEVMRRMPRSATVPRGDSRQGTAAPRDDDLPGLRISYEDNLSELATDDTFLYSNTTQTRPSAPQKLTRIAGVGSSPVVQYEGTGAYFLDRLSPGVWVLQVYPDAVMVADPYSGGTNEKVRILWGKWPMAIRLPDLGTGYRVFSSLTVRHPMVAMAAQEFAVKNGTFAATPGEYVLLARGQGLPGSIAGVEYIAPRPSTAAPAAFIEALVTWREGKPLSLSATIAAPGKLDCALRFRPAGATEFVSLPMKRARAYQYVAEVPARLVTPGHADYYVSVTAGGASYAFPAGADRDAAAPLVPAAELVGFAGKPAEPPALKAGLPEGKTARASWVSGRDAGKTALRMEVDGFGPPPSCAGAEIPAQAPANMDQYNAVTIIARGGPDTSAVEVTLAQKDGNAFGINVPLSTSWGEFTIPIAKLQGMWGTKSRTPDPAQLDHVTFMFGAWILADMAAKPHSVEVQSVQLRRVPSLWGLEIAGRDTPISLAEPAQRTVHLEGHPATSTVVQGMDPTRRALRVAVGGFGPQPDATSFRLSVSEETACCRDEMAQAKYIVIKARAGQPTTSKLELVFLEVDGSPWGTMDVPLTQQWRAIKLPLAQFRYFKHWTTGATGRGGEGDHLQPGKIQALNVCFGAWLYGDDAGKPQAIEIQDISLAKE